MSLFEDLGGDVVLKSIIDDFVEAMFSDMMIGYFFAHADKARIKTFEFQHAAEFLGADVIYEGRAIAVAHGGHQIRGGHFERRKTILKNVLIKHEIDDTIVSMWLAHIESLRAEVTRDPGSECRDGR